MNRFTILLLINIFGFIHKLNGYYICHDALMDVHDKENSNELSNFRLNFDEEEILNGKFPNEFTASFEHNEKQFSVKFARNKHQNNVNVYKATNGDVKKIELDDFNAELQRYHEKDGSSFATLMKANLNDEKVIQHPFRAMISLKVDDIDLDIVPVKLDCGQQQQRKKRDIYNTNDKQIKYHIFKRESKTFIDDTRMIHEISNQKASRHRRALNGQPFNLFVETIIVTDLSVYNDQISFAGTADPNLVFIFMRAYFSHYMNGVNARYQNSLSSDADLRLNIVLTNIVVLTTEADSNWTNPTFVGATGYPTYNGAPVIVATPTLNAFKSFMNSKTWPFTFDHAVGMTNKDLWTDSGFLPDQRSLALGFSPVGGICSDNRYSVVEEDGGFLDLHVTAHEIGHNLGANHDGDAINSACPASSNFIMTPTIGAFVTNLQNLQKFSSCSISQFKALLLTNSNTAVSTTGTCLVNTPISNYSAYTNNQYAGQLFNADDQCKMAYGSASSFCRFYSTSMCSSLQCRISDTNSTCSVVVGLGAVAGTPCDSGKICLSGDCVASSLAPVTDCPFGDDVVDNNQILVPGVSLPQQQMTCEAALTYLSGLGRSKLTYCTDPNFKKACCQTCKRYTGLTCVDKYANCPSFNNSCDAFFNTFEPIKTACPRTCKQCNDTQLTCSANLCQNGATCSNVVVASSEPVAFKCNCSTGYSGFLCETKNPCAPNPCQNGGVCQRLGSNGYVCLCLGSCSDYNCANCSVQCPTGYCQNGGTCSVSSGVLQCACLSGFTGKNCEYYATTSPCANGACLNGGLCQTVNNVAICSCLAAYTGKNCETLVSPTQCVTGYCKNGGTCISVSNTPICVCTTLYTGKTCEISLNPVICTSGYCQNNGTCVSSSGTPVCVCQPGYTGKQCDQVLPCVTNICQNGGTCVNDGTAAKCVCPPQFTGQYCNQRFDCYLNPCASGFLCVANPAGGYQCVCISMSCINGTTPAPVTVSTTASSGLTTTKSATTVSFSNNVCNPSPCLNQGTCVQTGASTAACQCSSSFFGFLCEYANPCRVNLCLNGGSCAGYFANGAVQYKCTCPIGYSGNNCEVSSFSVQCASTSCLNGGTCQVVSNVITCTCPALYTGTRCELNNNPCLVNNVNVCKNNGVCSYSSTSPFYTCSCVNGYYGTNCDYFSAVVTTTASSSTCVDKATFCASVTNLCSSGLTVSGVEPISTYCRRSCNNCNGVIATVAPVTSVPSTCVDSQANCVYWADKCNLFFSGQPVKNLCRRTCNNCA